MASRKGGANNAPGRRKSPPRSAVSPEPRSYEHREAKTLLRPDVGTQASFRKKKTPQTYRYDSSLSPALTWDGLPEVRLRRVKPGKKDDLEHYSVELGGLDVFDPVTMDTQHRDGSDVPAWLLDTHYNGLCFHVCQAFFPRTAAWDDLERSLMGQFDDSVWDRLAGTKSEPFGGGEHGQVAVKVIDDRGNELLVVKSLRDAE